MSTRKRMILYGGIAFVAVIAFVAALPFFAEASNAAKYAPFGGRFETGPTIFVSMLFVSMALIPGGIVFGLYIAVVVVLVDKDAGTVKEPVPRRSSQHQSARRSTDDEAPPFIMEVPPPPPSRRRT